MDMTIEMTDKLQTALNYSKLFVVYLKHVDHVSPYYKNISFNFVI